MRPSFPGNDGSDGRLAVAAAYVLRGNDLGTMTSAAPALYPHVWSWDAAFISAGLAKVSVARALSELKTLLQAQWRTGLERLGEHDAAVRLREATLQQVSDGTFAEYYEPTTAEPLGSQNQSWTAALVLLDWVL